VAGHTAAGSRGNAALRCYLAAICQQVGAMLMGCLAGGEGEEEEGTEDAVPPECLNEM
jgi:hypothetical protein